MSSIVMSPWLPWLRPRPSSIPVMPASTFGMAALAVALREIGKGETLGNNLGDDLDRYRKDRSGRMGAAGAWCAAFVSYCLEAGALEIGQPLPIRRSHSAKTLYERALKVGSHPLVPLPGDLACWHRGAAGARTGHIGIVSRLEPGVWFSIEGNKGTFPSRVREYPHELGEPLFLGFARLP